MEKKVAPKILASCQMYSNADENKKNLLVLNKTV